MRTPEVSQQQKKTAIHSAIGNSATVLPILVFQVYTSYTFDSQSNITIVSPTSQVLLADKLDGDLRWPMIAIVSPLLVALFTLILMSFGAKGGNKCNFHKCYHL